MHRLTSTLQLLLVSVLIVIFTSCKGQVQKNTESNNRFFSSSATAETVGGLGKDIDGMLQDRQGNYWFASNGQGVYRYDGKTLLQFTKKQGLCSDFVFSVQQDSSGTLWFSTRDGVCAYNGSVFTNYTDSIKNAPLGRLHYSPGGLFFAHPGGVCFYDGRRFSNFVIYPDGYQAPPNDMNRPYGVYSTLVDKAGRIWFGTQSQGVCYYDGKKFTYLTEKNLAGPAVRTLFQDSKCTLWFGNNGGGLFRYDGKTLSNITEEKGLGNPGFLSGHFTNKPGSLARVWSINEDKEGNLWIGTIDAGVWKYDGSKLTNYTTNDGLPGDAVWGIYKDISGELWFIVNGDSVCKFTGRGFTRVPVP